MKVPRRVAAFLVAEVGEEEKNLVRGRKLNTMVLTTLGGRIEQARQAKDFDVPQLARRIAVKTTTLKNWESDRSEPRPDKLTKLAGLLDVPLIWLLTGETPEAATRTIASSETATVAQKLERAVAMQQELSSLLIDISADVARLQREIEADRAA